MAQSATLPTLDLAKAIGNTKAFDVAEISDEIDFVPLQTGEKESLVGHIWQIVESKTAWYFNEMDNVKLFDRSGKFLGTRGRIGRGPDEFTMIDEIAADWQTGNHYLLGSQGKIQIIAYDPAGEIIARANSDLPVTYMTDAVHRNGKLIMLTPRLFSDPEPGAKSPLLEIYSSDLKHERSIEVLDRKISPVIRGVGAIRQGILSDNGASLIVYETLDETVFRLSDDMTLTPAYTFDFGRHAISPKAFGENPTAPWSENYRYVSKLWEGERYIICRTIGYKNLPPSANGVYMESLVFDRRNLAAGGFSALGPGGRYGLFLGGIAFTPLYVRDNRFVGYMQALDIVDNAASITNPKLKALAATLKEDSNPVIVVATLKK
jgi:hypothetical protein